MHGDTAEGDKHGSDAENPANHTQILGLGKVCDGVKPEHVALEYGVDY